MLKKGDRVEYQDIPCVVEDVETRPDGAVIVQARIMGSIARVNAPHHMFKDVYFACDCGADAVAWFGNHHSSWCSKFKFGPKGGYF